MSAEARVTRSSDGKPYPSECCSWKVPYPDNSFPDNSFPVNSFPDNSFPDNSYPDN